MAHRVDGIALGCRISPDPIQSHHYLVYDWMQPASPLPAYERASACGRASMLRHERKVLCMQVQTRSRVSVTLWRLVLKYCRRQS